SAAPCTRRRTRSRPPGRRSPPDPGGCRHGASSTRRGALPHAGRRRCTRASPRPAGPAVPGRRSGWSGSSRRPATGWASWDGAWLAEGQAPADRPARAGMAASPGRRIRDGPAICRPVLVISGSVAELVPEERIGQRTHVCGLLVVGGAAVAPLDVLVIAHVLTAFHHLRHHLAGVA